MSRILNDVKRSLRVQPKAPEPEPADTSGLGDAIAQVIRAQVQQQVADAVEKQAPAVAEHRRPFTDQPLSSTFPEPPPMAKPVKDLTVSLQRNEVGRVKSVSIGQTNFIVQRDSEGRVVRMVPQED